MRWPRIRSTRARRCFRKSCSREQRSRARLRVACALATLDTAGVAGWSGARRPACRGFARGKPSRCQAGSICSAPPRPPGHAALRRVPRCRPLAGRAVYGGRGFGGPAGARTTAGGACTGLWWKRCRRPRAYFCGNWSAAAGRTKRSTTCAECWRNGSTIGADESGKETLAGRQANAAIALAALDDPEPLWPLLRHRPDPRVRSLLIQRLAANLVPTRLILDRVSRPGIDSTERQALLLAWAEMRQSAVTAPLKDELLPRARPLYLDDPDPGVHSAAELLLRRWGGPEELAQCAVELGTALCPRTACTGSSARMTTRS